VKSDDPRSFVATNSLEVGMEYPNERVEVRAENRFSRDLGHLSTVGTVDDATVFDETWTRVGDDW
jgi:hypothetical protein